MPAFYSGCDKWKSTKAERYTVSVYYRMPAQPVRHDQTRGTDTVSFVLYMHTTPEPIHDFLVMQMHHEPKRQ